MANPKEVCGGRTTHTSTASSPLFSVTLRKYVSLMAFALIPSLITGWLFSAGGQAGLWGSMGHVLEESECQRCCFKSSHFRTPYIYSKNVSPGPGLLGGPVRKPRPAERPPHSIDSLLFPFNPTGYPPRLPDWPLDDLVLFPEIIKSLPPMAPIPHPTPKDGVLAQSGALRKMLCRLRRQFHKSSSKCLEEKQHN